jgi:3-hydroxyisobutyrate dehydrogenase-like beta-hydroxyacid dehydrogenase
VRPVFSSYADTIVHCGPLGAGTTCKLINNSISIGMATLMAEAFSTAAKAKVDLAALCDVLSAGAVDGRMWRMMEPWIRSGDDSRLKGSLRIAAKDLRAYGRVAEEAGTAIPVAQAASQTLRLALNLGHGEAFLPALPSILAALNGAKIAPTSDGQRPASASIA